MNLEWTDFTEEDYPVTTCEFDGNVRFRKRAGGIVSGASRIGMVLFWGLATRSVATMPANCVRP